MRIYENTSLRNFNFWSQAADNAAELTNEQLDQVECILEDAYPDGVEDTFVNDLFWHDFDTVLDWLGIVPKETLEKWWKECSEAEKQDYADLTWEEFLDEDYGEPLYDDNEIEMEAYHDCTEEANEWWNDLDYDEKVDIYNEHN